jgi:Ribosomal protein L7Ae/L30e/S12e/Gadd45 family
MQWGQLPFVPLTAFCSSVRHTPSLPGRNDTCTLATECEIPLRSCSAIEREQGQLCVLADDCNQPDYKKLIEHLCKEKSVDLVRLHDPFIGLHGTSVILHRAWWELAPSAGDNRVKQDSWGVGRPVQTGC